MTKHLTYLIGEPGVGKSTLAAYLTRQLPFEEGTSPFGFRRYDCGVTELGRRRESFSGTDALSMSVQPKVLQYLEGVGPQYVFAEGDRLANDGFFKGAAALGYDLWLYSLYGPDVAAARRADRGSQQDRVWIEGRRTKVYNLMEKWSAIPLPAHYSTDGLEELLMDPVSMLLKAARAAQALTTEPTEAHVDEVVAIMDAAGLMELPSR